MQKKIHLLHLTVAGEGWSEDLRCIFFDYLFGIKRACFPLTRFAWLNCYSILQLRYNDVHNAKGEQRRENKHVRTAFDGFVFTGNGRLQSKLHRVGVRYIYVE